MRERGSPDNTWERWADRDELRFSLRSVALNAAIFDRIFIVCEDGSAPRWLADDARVRIVPHSSIMPREYLPNFCSCSIESFLHKIPGLSERFVYANDDFIFWAPVDRGFFFEASKPRVLLHDHLVAAGPVDPKDDGHVAGKKNADALLDRRFGKARRRTVSHTPVALTKAACQAVWDTFPTEVAASAACRFRTSKSLAFTNHLVPHFMLLDGSGVEHHDQGYDVGIAMHNSRLKNLAASYLKFGGALPEQRARRMIEAAPDCRFLWIECDGTTIANILNERFAAPGPFEKP